MEKRIGPSIESCGTPHEIGVGEEEELPVETKQVLFKRYKRNQSRALSLRSTQCWW